MRTTTISTLAFLLAGLLAPAVLVKGEKLILPAEVLEAGELPQTFDLEVLGKEPLQRPLIGEPPRLEPNAIDNLAGYVVAQQQVGIRIDELAFLTPSTSLSWLWKKSQGKVCIVQVELLNPETLQHRYIGYAAGAWSESPSADPTVEVFVDDKLPSVWTKVERNLYQDCQTVLGWDQARITSIYLSPWDGQPGAFAGLTVRNLSTTVVAGLNLSQLSRIGRGQYTPMRLPDYSGKHIERFDTGFEECAPGRNSGANEWSAFGAIGDRDFNCMGRAMYVRYPLYDLAFRLLDGHKEIMPDSLRSFRLGLVNNRLPAIWGGWMSGGLLYKVSVMTVPDADNGNFDLYKLEVQNPADQPAASKLAAIIEGPPDMRLEDSVVRGLGDAPFLIAQGASRVDLDRRDWGLCDKRAKAYATAGGPGKTEPAVATYRVGLDGVPVVYRFKAESGKKYVVVLVSTPHISGYLLESPKKAGDLVYEY
ncbi:MAG: hypothetical protein M1608_13615, partial [Candidatus Omnitrophica bacterium]|nr:hypothetical protein [Candidatus Omnitrophota bacterium]